MAQKNLTTAPMPSERQKRLEDLKKNYNTMREKDREKVKGKFIFHEVPGGSFSFCFGPIYRGDDTERYDFTDGGIYEVPLGVARHLNRNGWYPEYGFIPGESETQQFGMRIKQKVRRF